MYIVFKPVKIKLFNDAPADIDVDGILIKEFLPLTETKEDALKIAEGDENLIAEVEKRDGNRV